MSSSTTTPRSRSSTSSSSSSSSHHSSQGGEGGTMVAVTAPASPAPAPTSSASALEEGLAIGEGGQHGGDNDNDEDEGLVLATPPPRSAQESAEVVQLADFLCSPFYGSVSDKQQQSPPSTPVITYRPSSSFRSVVSSETKDEDDAREEVSVSGSSAKVLSSATELNESINIGGDDIRDGSEAAEEHKDREKKKRSPTTGGTMMPTTSRTEHRSGGGSGGGNGSEPSFGGNNGIISRSSWPMTSDATTTSGDNDDDGEYDDEYDAPRALSRARQRGLSLTHRKNRRVVAAAGGDGNEEQQEQPNRNGGGDFYYDAKFRRMSSIMSDGFALIEEQTQREANSQSGDPTSTHASLLEVEVEEKKHHGTDLFIKSLRRSMHVMSQTTSPFHHLGVSINPTTKTLIRTIIYLSAYSILGENLRLFVGRLFGGICSASDAAQQEDYYDGYWLYSFVTAVNLCVTNDGMESVRSGGGTALFTDLPANCLGCFFLGLLCPPQDLGLQHLVSNTMMPVAFLNIKHWFQNEHLHHLALRTGFCGSLTTFSSWNTQMIRMIGGYGSSSNQQQQQVFSAFFGYMVGLGMAAFSLVFGQHVAVWIHRYTNQGLAKEEDMMTYAFSARDTTAAVDATTAAGAAAEGPTTSTAATATVNKKPLPDYERRYLAFLLLHGEHEWAKKNYQPILQDLEKWKLSTDEYRVAESGRVGDEELLTALHGIERKVLVDEEEIPTEWVTIANREKWDVQALQRFAKEAHRASRSYSRSSSMIRDGEENNGSSSRRCTVMRRRFWLSLPFVLAVSLLTAFAVLDWKYSNDDDASNNSDSEFYRKMWMSALFAPLGTLLRWKLSSLNGRLRGYWVWFPLGTCTANIVASIVSATIAGLSDSSMLLSDTTTQVLYAIKSGFAGSMSTVSTYIVEGTSLLKSYPHHAKSYYYMIGTLVLACLLSLFVYIPLVRIQ